MEFFFEDNDHDSLITVIDVSKIKQFLDDLQEYVHSRMGGEYEASSISSKFYIMKLRK